MGNYRRKIRTKMPSLHCTLCHSQVYRFLCSAHVLKCRGDLDVVVKLKPVHDVLVKCNELDLWSAIAGRQFTQHWARKKKKKKHLKKPMNAINQHQRSLSQICRYFLYLKWTYVDGFNAPALFKKLPRSFPDWAPLLMRFDVSLAECGIGLLAFVE